MGYDDFFKAAKEVKGGGAKPKPGTKSVAKASSKPKSSKAKASGPATAEEALIAMLKEKQMAKRAARKKKRGLEIPILGFGLAAICITGFAVGVYQPELFNKYMDRIEVSWMGIAGAASKKSEENSAATKGSSAATSSTSTSGEKNSTASAEKNWTQKELSHFSKLNERKGELDRREQELNELEEELHRQRGDIEARILKLEGLRRKISSVLKEKVEVDDAKVNKLVDVYSSMKPKQAAEILTDINEDLAVEVLGRMKKKKAAAILNLLKPQKAKVLSEKYTGYKRR